MQYFCDDSTIYCVPIQHPYRYILLKNHDIGHLKEMYLKETSQRIDTLKNNIILHVIISCKRNMTFYGQLNIKKTIVKTLIKKHIFMFVFYRIIILM